MQAAIATLINVPATDPESQLTAAQSHIMGQAITIHEGKLGEHTEA